MQSKSAENIFGNKLQEIRKLIIDAETLEKLADSNFKETITLLTKEEKRRGLAIHNLFAVNHFLRCASGNTDIDAQVYKTLTEALQGVFNFEGRVEQFQNYQSLPEISRPELTSLDILKGRLERIKQQDREAIKSPFVKWAVGIGLPALLIGISALVLYFFNPTEWVYPYGWMAVYEIAGAIIAPLFLIVSAYIFKVSVNHKESSLNIWWEGLQNIVNTLTSEDVALLQKLNSPEWKDAFSAAQKKFKPAAETNSPQFGSPLDNTPTPPTGGQRLVETQNPLKTPKIND